MHHRFLMIAGYAPSLLGFRAPLISALQQVGLQVHVAAPGLPFGNALRQRLEDKGLTVHDLPLQRAGTNPLKDLLGILSLWRLMRQVHPDFVLGYTIKPVIYGSLAAWLAHVPHRFALVTGLGYAFTEKRSASLLGRLVQRLYALALARVEVVFSQNPDDAALFRKLGLVTERNRLCVVNGSGVDVATFDTAPLPAAPLRFLLIARLLGDKGVREYAAAAARVRALYPEVTFSLVGWIDENPDAISQAELDAWVAAGALEFLGRLGDVRPAIAGCHVYVLPSYYREGTPRTNLEAMAMGRAIITTDAPGCRETVVEGENGFLVPVKNVDALVEAMLRFVREPELAVRMGARSREIAEEKYDVRKVNAVMLQEMGIGASGG